MHEGTKNLKKSFEHIKDLIREANFRLSHRHYTYNTGEIVHKKQLEFHKNPSRNRWIFGGNRTGKTECGAMEAVWFALGLHPHRRIRDSTTGWVVSLSLGVQRDVAQAKILKYLPPRYITDIVMRTGRKDAPENGIIDFITVKNVHGGESRIGFKSCDQGREKFQGTSLDWVWFDEEPPEDIYEECLLRTLDKSGDIWGTMTPLKGRTWLFERIYMQSQDPKSGIHVQSMSWADNPFLPKEEIKNMEKSLSAKQLESRKFGKFMEAEGLVFDEFSDENIVDPTDATTFARNAVVENEKIAFTAGEYIDVFISIDPGYVAPTACVWVVRRKEEYFVVADYSVAGKTVDEHASYIIAKTAELGLDKHSPTVLIDSASLQKTLGSPTSVAQRFRDAGLDVRTAVNKRVIDGIMQMKSLIKNAHGVPRLFIARNCVNLLKEIRGYYWGDDERPIKRNDHCLDALRYIIASNLPSKKTNISTVAGIKKDLLSRLKQGKVGGGINE